MSEKNELSKSYRDWEKDVDLDELDKKMAKELEMTQQDKDLAKVTGFVSKNYGPKAALIFYIDFIQPIKERLEELKDES
jgi:hypothetical protein